MAAVPSGGGNAVDLTSASPYAAGTSVSIKAVASSGYHFVNWAAPAGTFANVNGAQTTFTMPTQNATVTANFVRVYDLTLAADPTGGGTATDLTSGSPYSAGSSVNIRAVANSGYHFVNWTAPAGTFGNATVAQTTFTMPAQSATITANFAVDLYFRTDAYVMLNGPATLPPEARNPCVILEVWTNMVVDRVRVDLADGRSVVIPRHTDVFGPGVDQTTWLRFFSCEPGMPIAGGGYIFTGLDAAAEPVPGARNTDIWVGVEPPNPPTNVRAELTEDGILVNWDESAIIPGSFEPAAKPQLGYYQLGIHRIETGEMIYGACRISTSSHLVPQDKADFIEGKDYGLSLSEMEDGTYYLSAFVLSVAPEGSLGRGLECNNNPDPGENIAFTIQDGQIIIG